MLHTAFRDRQRATAKGHRLALHFLGPWPSFQGKITARLKAGSVCIRARKERMKEPTVGRYYSAKSREIKVFLIEFFNRCATSTIWTISSGCRYGVKLGKILYTLSLLFISFLFLFLLLFNLSFVLIFREICIAVNKSLALD